MWIEHVLLETNKIVCTSTSIKHMYSKLSDVYYHSGDGATPPHLEHVNNRGYNDPQQLTSIYDLCTNILSRLSI